VALDKSEGAVSRTEISEKVKRWNFSRKFHFSARFVSYRLKLEQSYQCAYFCSGHYSHIFGGPWGGNHPNRFLGVKFLIHGKTHYGWIRVTVRAMLFPFYWNHPYSWRTNLRSVLLRPLCWWVDKGEDCETVAANQVWYNEDNLHSTCYHCRVVREGQRWSSVDPESHRGGRRH
jgi:hypothetical protein